MAKKYLVSDSHDREYTVPAHGINFSLDAGEEKEVNEAEAKHLQEHFPYLNVREKPEPEEETVFGVPQEKKKKK